MDKCSLESLGSPAAAEDLSEQSRHPTASSLAASLAVVPLGWFFIGCNCSDCTMKNGTFCFAFQEGTFLGPEVSLDSTSYKRIGVA